jgi:4-hydroxybenzoate polyprenyltransferase
MPVRDPRAPGGRPRLRVLALLHPFPSLLNAAAVAALATVAGAHGPLAILLGASMLCLQASIGAVNDLVDAPDDALAKPAKPIPAGLVSVAAARGAAGATAGLGLGLAASVGPGVLALALVTLALGLAYDLRLKRTAWAWLPFALALPVVPAYAWIGAAEMPPPRLEWLLPLGILAGAGLSLANGLADLEADRATGVPGLVARLGRPRSVTLLSIIQAVVLGGAWLGSLVTGALAMGGQVMPTVPAALAGGSLLLGAGTVLSSREPRMARQRGWEAQAVGCALLAVGWLLAAVGGRPLPGS